MPPEPAASIRSSVHSRSSAAWSPASAGRETRGRTLRRPRSSAGRRARARGRRWRAPRCARRPGQAARISRMRAADLVGARGRGDRRHRAVHRDRDRAGSGRRGSGSAWARRCRRRTASLAQAREREAAPGALVDDEARQRRMAGDRGTSPSAEPLVEPVGRAHVRLRRCRPCTRGVVDRPVQQVIVAEDRRCTSGRAAASRSRISVMAREGLRLLALRRAVEPAREPGRSGSWPSPRRSGPWLSAPAARARPGAPSPAPPPPGTPADRPRARDGIGIARGPVEESQDLRHVVLVHAEIVQPAHVLVAEGLVFLRLEPNSRARPSRSVSQRARSPASRRT